MSTHDHLNAFRIFAGKLVVHYTQSLMPTGNTVDTSRRLYVLETAMYRMENDLNEKLANIIADTEQAADVNEIWLEKGLIEISNSSIKELLSRNFRGQ